MLSFLPFLCAVSLARVPGTVLPIAPSVAPGRVAPLPSDPLAEASKRWQQDDPNGVVALMVPYARSKRSRKDFSSVHLLLGRAWLKLDQPAAASSAMYKVRARGGATGSIAAWYEANADMRRGRYQAAEKECRSYRARWPQGTYAEECRVLIGDARAARGDARGASSAYYGYLHNPANESHKRGEEMRLRTAFAVSSANPDKGIPLLQRLVLDHWNASTAMGAKQVLAQLKAEGREDAIVPTDVASRMLHASSLRRSGWAAEAWTMFQALENEADSDERLARWVQVNKPRFVTKTRHFGAHTTGLEERYRAEAEAGKADPKLCWKIFGLWVDAGEWAKAAAWGRTGIEDHPDAYSSRWKLDDLAWAEMLAAEWSQSHTHWRAAQVSNHGNRADSRFYEGFTAFHAGDLESAEAGLSNAIAKNPTWRTAGYYWRAKVRAAAGDAEGAQADIDQTLKRDSSGWYRLLLDRSEPELEGWTRRDGTWQGEPEPVLPQLSPPSARAQVSVGQWPAATPVFVSAHSTRAGRDQHQVSLGWRTLSWPLKNTELPPAPAASGTLVAVSRQLPSGYIEGDHYNFKQGLSNLRGLGNRLKATWPELPAAAPLAKAGLYNDSGPIAYRARREHKDPSLILDPAHRAQVLTLPRKIGGFGAAAQSARDHHHAVLMHWGREKAARTEEERIALLKLQYPVAYARELWAHCERWNMDPYLVLSVMRKESAYGASAISRTGAIGLMQFLKSTGAKVSALLEEPLYSPRKLLDPQVNLRYSVYYLKVLRDRFGGNFPIGVGSYNGGPHHMSRLHRAQLGELPMDAFVEMIDRREPRDYIKKVMGTYQLYATLYGPPGAKVVLPERLTEDDPNVVDF
jgi:soluble lytic murein transglycosylase-like protein